MSAGTDALTSTWDQTEGVQYRRVSNSHRDSTVAKTRRIWYFVGVPIRECLVSFEGPRGVRHRVTVQPSSVLEAAGLGLKRVLEQEMLDADGGFGDITVEVCTRTVHTVPIFKLREWRDANSG